MSLVKILNINRHKKLIIAGSTLRIDIEQFCILKTLSLLSKTGPL
jgi:hypothetical protein